MPNYSHGTKLTLASVEEPPYLTVGTDVSAKYKGAFCEAKIIDVNKHVKLRVLFDGSSGSHLIDDTDLKTGSTLATGTRIEAKHPEKAKQQTYVQATITKILDHSRYTVVFDDGDQCILRRNSLCLKSGKHFAESETLDQLPLTNPEHFGNPVKVGASEQPDTSNITQQNITPKTQNNHLLLNDKPRVKSSSSTTNSSSTTSEDNKSNASELTNNRKRQYNNQDSINDNNTKRLKKEKGIAQTNSTTGTTGTARRGSTKGGKRRESVNNGSKNAMDVDDNSVDSSIDSGDANLAEANVKYELIDVGVKLMVQYGKGKIQNFYEAKVNKIEINNAGKIRYFVHYTGWNNRYDEWITKNRIHSIVIDKENGSRDGKAKHPEVTTANSTSAPVSSTATTTGPKSESKEKDKEDKPTRTRRARQSEALTNTPVTSNSTQVTSTTTNSIAVTSPISIATTAPVTVATPVITTVATTATAITTTSVAVTTVTTSSTTTAPVTAKPSNAAPTTQTAVDSSRKSSVPAVVSPPKQAVVAPSIPTIAPKTEVKEKEKEEKPTRTRRARQVEALTNTPLKSNSTQNAPTITNSIAVASSISIATTAPVTATPVATTSATTTSATTTSKATTPVITISVTASPLIATTLAQKTTVDSTKDDLKPVVVLPATQAAPADDVGELKPNDPPSPATATEKVKEPHLVEVAVAAIDSGPTYRFCEEIDESDCDKKISILQERIMALRQTYTSLKTELADLDRRKKRPRTERSNSDHISNCSVVCRS